jgi:hypothetical protein
MLWRDEASPARGVTGPAARGVTGPTTVRLGGPAARRFSEPVPSGVAGAYRDFDVAHGGSLP